MVEQNDRDDQQPYESDCLDSIEQQYIDQSVSGGYELGLRLGSEAGRDDGASSGSAEGARVGAELGYYKGMTMGLKALLQQFESSETRGQLDDKLEETDARSTRILHKLDEILRIVDSFPSTNQEECADKLNELRAKFKHSISLLNIPKSYLYKS